MEACFLGKSVPPQEQTSSGHPGMSEMCQERNTKKARLNAPINFARTNRRA
jgi:hypothetical protein